MGAVLNMAPHLFKASLAGAQCCSCMTCLPAALGQFQTHRAMACSLSAGHDMI